MTVTTSSPTSWRRWLAIQLRRLRTDAGISMQEAATILRCSTPKITHIERAQRGVGAEDLDRLLEAYGVPQNERALYDQARRDSQKKGWWQRFDERVLPSHLSLYVGLEQGASRLHAYEPQIINGLLQTPDYARETCRRGTLPRAEERVTRLVELRMSRQAALDREPDPLALWVILDEATLRRQVGNAQIMAFQLEHIVTRAAEPNITVQVLPFTAGAHGAVDGCFFQLSFPWEGDPGVVCADSPVGTVYYDGPREVEAYSLTFQQLCALALPPDESVELVRAVAEEYDRAAVPSDPRSG